MQVSDETLKRLSHLDLKQYAGDLRAITGDDREIYEQLMSSPIDVRVTKNRVICATKLYDICCDLEGAHDEFRILRRIATDRLMKEFSGLGRNLLSVLFHGIYIGEAGDLLNNWEENRKRILYPTRGFSQRVAEISFK